MIEGYFWLCFVIVLAAFIPGLIWLLFFLRFDKHPEPKGMIIRTFLWGMLAAPIAIVLEFFLSFLSGHIFFAVGILLNENLWSDLLFAPVVEESLKYLAAKTSFWERSAEFDEPIDFMIYLITAALGFAAMENVVYLLGNNFLGSNLETMVIQDGGIIIARSLTANLLHALSAATLGYFIALSWKYRRRRKYFFLAGLAGAVLIHSSYNYLVIAGGGTNLAEIFTFVLLGLGIVIFLFKRVRKMSSVCFLSSIEKLRKSKVVKVKKIYGHGS